MAIIDVIKYNGGPDVFAWRYPSEEIGTWSQLIVNESQEAILFKGGRALDVFQSGRHKLDTANIPLFNKIVNIPFGKKTPFAAEIWFINKVYSLDIKWGTATPIQLQDPKYNVFLPLRSYGQFGIRISDSQKFLTSLVGTLPTFDKDTMTKFFRGMFLTKVKDAISTYLVTKKISVLEINSFLEELSDELKDKMLPILSQYGIELINFYVNDINVPENDTAVIQLKKALAKKAEMDIIGYDYRQERSFDTMEGAATNPGSMQSGLMGAGLGLGVGAGMGSFMGKEFSGMVNQSFSTVSTKSCSKCKQVIDSAERFCSKCGWDTCMETSEPTTSKSATCTECNAVIPVTAKFCPECGHSLLRKCSKCSSTVDKDQKFCPECGEKL